MYLECRGKLYNIVYTNEVVVIVLRHNFLYYIAKFNLSSYWYRSKKTGKLVEVYKTDVLYCYSEVNNPELNLEVEDIDEIESDWLQSLESGISI